MSDALQVDPELADMVRSWFALFRPPARPPLSAWARQHARLDDGSPFRPFPFQTGMMDAFTDPGVRQITVMKSSRVGYSKIVQCYLGYCITQDPRHIAIWQPTIEDADHYGKTDVAQLFDIDAISEVLPQKSRDGDNTVRFKAWPGGSLLLRGANAAKEFRRITVDTAVLEECDGYPPMAGAEGDQVELAWKRVLTSMIPLKVAGSSPTLAGDSKIASLFEYSTREYRFVPCPHCHEMQVLEFGDGSGAGLRWEPKDNPTSAWFVCVNGCIIDEEHKSWMDANGEWRAKAPENFPHRGFHIWQAYSQFEHAGWLNIAKDFVRVKDRPSQYRVFKNQTLGLPYEIRGDAPPWQALYRRREDYEAGVVPRRATLVTGAIDVQKDRLEFALWAWSRTRESWLIHHEIVMGSPFTAAPWTALYAVVARTWPHASGIPMTPIRIAVDIGYAANEASAFCRRFSRTQVVPIKGASTQAAPAIGSPRPVDTTTPAGKKAKTKVWLIGDHVLKLQLYGLLEIQPPTDEELAAGVPYPEGFIHLPTWVDDEFCRQMVAETWDEQSGKWTKYRANEALDLWKYSRAMAILAGVERMRPADWDALEAQFDAAEPEAGDSPDEAPAAPTPTNAPAPAAPKRKPIRSSYMKR